MNIKKFLDYLLPKYAYIPLLSVLIVNFTAYCGTRLITRDLAHFDFTLTIDNAIPFVPAFSSIYLLAYVQWIAGFVMISRDSRELCYRVLSGEIISKLICMVLFLVIPTTMIRAEITSDGFFDSVVKLIYQTDSADNLFPSLHCLESWICFRGAMQMKKTGKWYVVFSLIFSLLVFASTVFVKQHVFVDIIAGVLVCEIGQFISKKVDSARVFRRIESLIPNTEMKNEEEK